MVQWHRVLILHCLVVFVHIYPLAMVLSLGWALWLALTNGCYWTWYKQRLKMCYQGWSYLLHFCHNQKNERHVCNRPKAHPWLRAKLSSLDQLNSRWPSGVWVRKKCLLWQSTKRLRYFWHWGWWQPESAGKLKFVEGFCDHGLDSWWGW